MEFWIGLVAAGISIILAIIVGFLTRELVFGLVCAVLVFAAVVFGSDWYASKIADKPSLKKMNSRERQAHLRGTAAKPTEDQTTPERVAVRAEPQKPEEALAECEGNTALSKEATTPTTMGHPRLCARCGQPLRDWVKFCEKCGAKAGEYAPKSGASTEKERPCGNCGCTVAGNSKTCEWCGTEQAW